MKKILIFLLSIFVYTFYAYAGDNWDTAQKIDQGRYVETNTVALTTYTASLIYSHTVNDANGDIFNNTANTIYIGTNTTTLLSTGFPILSSTTYTLGGMYTGDIYGTLDASASHSRAVKTIKYKMK